METTLRPLLLLLDHAYDICVNEFIGPEGDRLTQVHYRAAYASASWHSSYLSGIDHHYIWRMLHRCQQARIQWHTLDHLPTVPRVRNVDVCPDLRRELRGVVLWELRLPRLKQLLRPHGNR